jgi:hypothetical protein
MICFDTYNRGTKQYVVIDRLPEPMSAEDAAKHCDALERQRNDGMAVFAYSTSSGRTVASAEGPAVPEETGPDAATTTGMYDAW